jgi:predicted alpha/beta hydrolase family esterase
MADAALFDSRVLFAAKGLQPDAADRFASDLFWHEAVRDPWLREFTRAAAAAPIPIILGGHSVVSGGLHALVEIIQSRAATTV